MAEIQWLAETSYCSVPIVYRTPGSLWPCMGEYARVIRSFQVQHSGRRNYQLSLNRLAEQWFVDAGVVSQGSALRPLNQPMAQKKKTTRACSTGTSSRTAVVLWLLRSYTNGRSLRG